MEKSKPVECVLTDLDVQELRTCEGGILTGPIAVLQLKIVLDAWDDITEWAPSFWDAVVRGFWEGFEDGKEI
jgi:hypothetical protein